MEVINSTETVNIAGISRCSVVDGPGLRQVIFFQGCYHKCKGCHNPSTWDTTGGMKMYIKDLVFNVEQNLDRIDGVTISGGDPFVQIAALEVLVKELKKLNVNIWVYTGYTVEQLRGIFPSYYLHEIFSNIDVLVDGPFILEKKSYKCKFRGSTNQRILHIKEGE